MRRAVLNCGGETIVEGDLGDQGEFDSEEQRLAWLLRAALVINARMEKAQ